MRPLQTILTLSLALGFLTTASIANSKDSATLEDATVERAADGSLAAGEVPLAFNCSAGKDRTGLAAALLLTLLDVPRETVVEDYALSERIVDYEAEFVGKGKQTGMSKPSTASLAHLPAEVRATLLRSDPDYIRAALSSIERREGSIDAFFQRVLSITQDEQARIRELLLERS